jgi:hypothetical protein
MTTRRRWISAALRESRKPGAPLPWHRTARVAAPARMPAGTEPAALGQNPRRLAAGARG